MTNDFPHKRREKPDAALHSAILRPLSIIFMVEQINYNLNYVIDIACYVMSMEFLIKTKNV